MKKQLFKILFLWALLVPFFSFGQTDDQIKKKIITSAWFVESDNFDASYQAVLDRATALGYTKPSAAQQILQNQLVVDLKAAGIWALLDIFYVFATDGDSDFATLNWKNPALYQCTKVNAPTFTVNLGFEGNGTTNYLNTNWSPGNNGVNYTDNSASIFADSHIALSVSSAYLFGSGTAEVTTVNNTRINPSNNVGHTTVVINGGTGSVISIAPSNGIGFYYGEKINAGTDINLYRDGVFIANDSGLTDGLSPTQTMIILGYNVNGTPGLFRATRTGVFGAGAPLTGLQDDIYTLYNNYLTSL